MIGQNAGAEGSIVLAKVRESKDKNFGNNAQTDVYENLVTSGVIDPTRGAMTDPVGISSILTSIKTATDIAKILRESTTSLLQAEGKLKLAELIGALAEAKIQLAEIQESLAARDTRIHELESEAQVRAALIFDDASYWLPTSGGRDGPFCTRCWDAERKLVRLSRSGNPDYGKCPNCSNSFQVGRAVWR